MHKQSHLNEFAYVRQLIFEEPDESAGPVIGWIRSLPLFGLGRLWDCNLMSRGHLDKPDSTVDRDLRRGKTLFIRAPSTCMDVQFSSYLTWCSQSPTRISSRLLKIGILLTSCENGRDELAKYSLNQLSTWALFLPVTSQWSLVLMIWRLRLLLEPLPDPNFTKWK